MAHIPLATFKGEIPRLEVRTLPPNFAARAVNTSFENGTVKPLRGTTVAQTFVSDVSSFYNLDGTWLGWTGIVDVARAPIAQDRIYYTGDGVPKVRDGSTVYNLALPAPTTPPTVTNLSTPDPQFERDVLYAYTYVTSLGEESQPSPLSSLITTSNGVTVRVSSFAAPVAGRGVTHIRIYRSETSATGTTSLFFVAEITAATVQYDHDIEATPLQEVIPSIDYDPPPDDMAGLVSMPNGMMAAFSGKDVLFCEPYIPHAWPIKYILTVDYPVIGLAAFGSNLAILTAGTPYLMQGTHPENMVSDKVEKAMPCVSRRGIVDIGYAALYPSPDGLVMITPTDAKVMTKGLFTREQWQALVPSSIIAERFKGKYVFLRVTDADLSYLGGPPAGFAAPDRIDLFGSGPTLAGDPDEYLTLFGGTPDSAFGEQRLGMLDFEDGDAFFVQTDIETPRAMLSDEASANLYLLRSDSRTVVEWESESAVRATMTWRSKLFSSFVPVTYGAVFIRTERPMITGDVLNVRIYADGALVHTVTRSNQIERLPGGLMAQEWDIELESNMGIVTFQMASSVDELMQVPQ